MVSLLVSDELSDAYAELAAVQSGKEAANKPSPGGVSKFAANVERIAERAEAIAERLEAS